MAERIQARATRRCGELLKQVPSGQGSRNQHGERRNGAVTRQKAAEAAGLSERQRVTALRIATLPAPEFEALVESDSPPTVTQLADLGRQTRASRPPELVRAARARRMFGDIRDFCEQNSPSELAQQFTPQDAASMRDLVATVNRWLDQFAASLPQGSAAAQEPEAPM